MTLFGLTGLEAALLALLFEHRDFGSFFAGAEELGDERTAEMLNRVLPKLSESWRETDESPIPHLSGTPPSDTAEGTAAIVDEAIEAYDTARLTNVRWEVRRTVSALFELREAARDHRETNPIVIEPDQGLERLHLSRRARNALARKGIVTLEGLLSARWLSHGMRGTTIAEIQKALEPFGLALRDDWKELMDGALANIADQGHATEPPAAR